LIFEGVEYMLTNNEQSEKFTYWKRPWQKWLVFIGGTSQIIALFLNIQEYNEIAIIKDKLFSAVEWESYARQQSFQGALNGFIAAIFLGCFLVGIFSQSKKVAYIAEGLLLLILAVAWGFVGFTLQLASVHGIKIIWGLLLLLTFCGSVYAFCKSRKIY
jgi:hypothetical protein